MDAILGKARYQVLDRQHATPIRRNELVRLRGVGIGRIVRFHEYVTVPDGRDYVTVRDTYDRKATGGFISVRPNQVSRVRNQ